MPAQQIAPGQRFGRLTVVGRAEMTAPKNARWKCRCECGKITQPRAADLRRGVTQSCGCRFRERVTKDMTGLRVGRLTVLGRAGLAPSGQIRWRCQCDCGNIVQPHGHDLRRGTTKSCGCWNKEIIRKRFAKDPTGQRFARLIVLHRAGKTRFGRTLWRCRCDCGRETEITTGRLGRTKSCGCLQRERAAQLRYRHGGAKSPLYACWVNIRGRCLNPKNAAFKHYGGRGITIAPEWTDDFIAFKDYVDQNLGPKPEGDYSIDRIENHEGYFPGNLRWVARTVQNHNRRNSLIEKTVSAVLTECVTRPPGRMRRSPPKRSHGA